MQLLKKMTGPLAICCLLTTASCAAKLDHKVPLGPESVQCPVMGVHSPSDCVTVTKAFVKEHGELFDRLIRTLAEWQKCRDKE